MRPAARVRCGLLTAVRPARIVRVGSSRHMSEPYAHAHVSLTSSCRGRTACRLAPESHHLPLLLAVRRPAQTVSQAAAISRRAAGPCHWWRVDATRARPELQRHLVKTGRGVDWRGSSVCTPCHGVAGIPCGPDRRRYQWGNRRSASRLRQHQVSTRRRGCGVGPRAPCGLRRSGGCPRSIYRCLARPAIREIVAAGHRGRARPRAAHREGRPQCHDRSRASVGADKGHNGGGVDGGGAWKLRDLAISGCGGGAPDLEKVLGVVCLPQEEHAI
jgi:hypothetical protein